MASENATPHSLIKKTIGRINRSVITGSGESGRDVVSPYLIERYLLKEIKAAVYEGKTRLPKMKGMGWPLIQDKIIGASAKEQSKAHQILKQGKVYEAILHLFPNLKS